jgi:hypothetical protein
LKHHQTAQARPWKAYANDFNVSKDTVRNIAAAQGYHKRVMRRKPFISLGSKKKRRLWARANRTTNWRRVIFTDKTSLELGAVLGSRWTIRRPGEESEAQHLQPTFPSDRSGWVSTLSHTSNTPSINIDTISTHPSPFLAPTRQIARSASRRRSPLDGFVSGRGDVVDFSSCGVSFVSLSSMTCPCLSNLSSWACVSASSLGLLPLHLPRR